MNSISTSGAEPFFKDLLRRDRSIERKHQIAPPRQQRFLLEPLESRRLLSVDLLGIPNWVPEGPAPIVDAGRGNVFGPDPATSLKVGAASAVAVDPMDTKHLLVATVNGGIWQTSDSTVANPTWTTTTDRLPSLSISSIAFSPVNDKVIYAGTGDYSSFGGSVGGHAIGVYKSSDGSSGCKSAVAAAIRQLQHGGGLVSGQLADHYRELAGAIR